MRQMNNEPESLQIMNLFHCFSQKHLRCFSSPLVVYAKERWIFWRWGTLGDGCCRNRSYREGTIEDKHLVMLPHASHRNVLKRHMPTWIARIHPRCVVPGARPCTGWKVNLRLRQYCQLPWFRENLPASQYRKHHKYLNSEAFMRFLSLWHWWPTYVFRICRGLCSEDPNPIPEHDCKSGVYCGSIFIWLSEFIAVIAKTWTLSKMMVVQLLGGHDPVMFCSNLIKWLKPVLSEFLKFTFFFNATSPRWQRNVAPQYAHESNKRIGINSRASTKMLLLKILLDTFGMFTVQAATNALHRCVLAFNPTSPRDAGGPTRSSQMKLTCSPTHQGLTWNNQSFSVWLIPPFGIWPLFLCLKTFLLSITVCVTWRCHWEKVHGEAAGQGSDLCGCLFPFDQKPLLRCDFMSQKMSPLEFGASKLETARTRQDSWKTDGQRWLFGRALAICRIRGIFLCVCIYLPEP